MVQAGGLEPPTSGSTDQRSNQLSYACTRDRPGSMPDPSGRKLGAARPFGKRPCGQKENPGSIARVTHPLSRDADTGERHAALLNAAMLSLIGSAVSVATFWACSDSSLAWAIRASNCLRK